MTLLSTLQLAKHSLFASQAGIQVAANNIANADTPGYVRERLVQSTAPPQRIRGLITGSGVQVDGVVREVDEFLLQRLRSATSDLASGEMQEKIFVELEAAIGELSDSDLSTALTDFFSSLQDVLNQPEDPAVRNLAVLRGEGLAANIRHLDGRVRDLRVMTNEKVGDAGNAINRLVDEIAGLNLEIMEIEQGGAIVSDAVGLRDKRDRALGDLARIIDIQVQEQPTGAVNVFVGGDYLVFDGATQHVTAVTNNDRGLAAIELRLARTDAVLPATSGELVGLITARDEVLGGFLDELDTFASTLLFEFNKVHSTGQGLTGFDSLVSEHRIEDSSAALDDAGLPFSPVHGSFQIELVDPQTGMRETHDVFVQLNGLSTDTTFDDLAAELNAIDGLSATITMDGHLTLQSSTPGMVFNVANDTTGLFAAVGMNNFFTGTGASSIGVSQALFDDPGKLAVSQGGIGHDTRNGELLADMLQTPLEARDGATLAQMYERWMGETAQASSLAQAVAEGYRAFHQSLEGEHLGLSGVSLDEEAVNMMAFQRTFQASAKVISTISELLDVLVNL